MFNKKNGNKSWNMFDFITDCMIFDMIGDILVAVITMFFDN